MEKKFKPQYENCVLLVFEDHNYYDDSDSWTVYYDGNKKEIAEEFWTTRGYCPTINANPQDIEYSLHDCPKNLLDEIVALLLEDVKKNINFEEMAENCYPIRYKYQEEAAIKCRQEFVEIASKVIDTFNDVWHLCYLSKKVHTGTSFDYRMGRYVTLPPLREYIMREVKTKPTPIRKRAKAVYGKEYNGIVKKIIHHPKGWYNDFDHYIIIADVEGFSSPFYLKSANKKGLKEGGKLRFAGYLVSKDGYQYNFVNKMRIIEEGDILSWH